METLDVGDFLDKIEKCLNILKTNWHFLNFKLWLPNLIN